MRGLCLPAHPGSVRSSGLTPEGRMHEQVSGTVEDAKAQAPLLSWTVSLYINRDDLPGKAQRAVEEWLQGREKKRTLDTEDPTWDPTGTLRKAIDPLLNDVSGRERLNKP